MYSKDEILIKKEVEWEMNIAELKEKMEKMVSKLGAETAEGYLKEVLWFIENLESLEVCINFDNVEDAKEMEQYFEHALKAKEWKTAVFCAYAVIKKEERDRHRQQNF